MITNKNFLLFIKSLGIGTLLLSLAQTSAMSFNITLDEFTDFEGSNTSQFLLLFGNETEGTSVNDLDSSLNNTVFGGQRTIQITKGSDPRMTPAVAFSTLSISGGSANFNGNDGYESFAEIIWDGNDGTANNFETNGQKSLQINIASLNLGNDPEGNSNPDIILNFELQDTTGQSGVISRTIDSNISSGSGGTDVFFTYGSRDNQSLDMTKIDYVRFYTSSVNLGDNFTFNLIQTSDVPFEFSPSLGLLLSGGLCGFLTIRNKKSLKQKI